MPPPLFVRPVKNEDYDSDDEKSRRKRARREYNSNFAAAVVTQGATPVVPSTAEAFSPPSDVKGVLDHLSKRCVATKAIVATSEADAATLFITSLKPFQHTAVEWAVQRLLREHVGIILADEMGLGKTFQSIATYVTLKHRLQAEGAKGPTGPLLVVTPLSVVPTWVNEFSAHVKSKLKVQRYLGSREERDEIIARVTESILLTSCGTPAAPYHQNCFDVLVTTPEYIVSENFFLKRLNFSMIVFDEAHRVKNASSRLYQVLLQEYVPHIPHRMLLTGTPLSNSPLELWNLLRLVNPELCSGCQLMNGIDEDGDEMSNAAMEVLLKESPARAAALRGVADVVMLRRLKKDVLQGLPPLTEYIIQAPLSPLQKHMYGGILRKDLTSLVSAAAKGTTKTSLLNTVMQLRKCSNHPYMFAGVEKEPFEIGEHIVRNSTKMVLLDSLLRKLKKEGGHKVLLFSQFSFMLDILQDYLSYRHFHHVRLDGSVRGEEREEAVDAFQFATSSGGEAAANAPFVFLLSTRAGGVGLTLTAADTVVFFDSDWNPQVDLQAQQRAHRIGQTKPVTVYRLLCEHTVEEAILKAASRKLKIASEYIMSATSASSDDDGKKLSADELKNFIRLGATAMATSATESGEGKQDKEREEADWHHFVDNLDITSLLRSTAHVQKISIESVEGVDEVLDSAEERKAFEDELKRGDAQLLKMKAEQDAAMAMLGSQQFGPRRRGTDLCAAEAPTLTLDQVVKKKTTEWERWCKLRKQWLKQGYLSLNLPVSPEMYRCGDSALEVEASPFLEDYATLRKALAPSDEETKLPTEAPSQAYSPVVDNDADQKEVAATGDDDDEEEGDNEAHALIHVEGDLLSPVRSDPMKRNVCLVVIPVNNSGAWGSGRLFQQVATVAPDAPVRYCAAKENNDLRMADAHLIFSAKQPLGVQIILAVIQRSSTASSVSGGEVDLKALDTVLEKIAAYGKYLRRHETRAGGAPAVTVHFPMLSAISKEAAYALDKLLVKRMSCGIQCYMYHLTRKRAGASPTRKQSPPSSQNFLIDHAAPVKPTATKRERDDGQAAPLVAPNAAPFSHSAVVDWTKAIVLMPSGLSFAPHPMEGALTRQILIKGGVVVGSVDEAAALVDEGTAVIALTSHQPDSPERCAAVNRVKELQRSQSVHVNVCNIDTFVI